MDDVPTTAQLAPGRWFVDSARSTIGFRTRNFVGMKVEGRFKEVDGTVDVADAPEESSIRVSIPVDGVDTGSRMRDRDLLKPSVFDADRWPDIRFESTGIRAAGDAQLTITGTMFVRDQATTVELVAGRADAADGEHHVTATARVNPRDVGIRHPFVRRDVEITIDAWLRRADG